MTFGGGCSLMELSEGRPTPMNLNTPHHIARAPDRLAVFLLAFLFVSLSPLPAATTGPVGTIRGVVSSGATGNNLNNASVRVKGAPHEVLTDRDGSFEITLAPGQYEVVVSYTGLEPETRAHHGSVPQRKCTVRYETPRRKFYFEARATVLPQSLGTRPTANDFRGSYIAATERSIESRPACNREDKPPLSTKTSNLQLRRSWPTAAEYDGR
jgi:hypothetical protein